MSSVVAPQPPLRRLATSGRALIGILALLVLAARTTGAGWLIVLACLLIAVLITGIVWPRIALRLVRMTARVPADGTAGDSVPISVTARRAGPGVLARHTGDWQGVDARSPVTVGVVSNYRGVYDEIHLEVACGAPFGLSWASRVVEIPVDRPLTIAPRTVDAEVPVQTALDDRDENSIGSWRGGDHVRSAREYVPGDPFRLVHWSLTARRGDLLVKEFEAPSRQRIHISVHLVGEQDGDERTCERAMGLVASAHSSGIDVSLGTAGPDGPQIGMSRTPRSAGRQLAAACEGTCPPVPDGVDEHIVVRSAQ